jgi:hypothetical protein
MITGGVYGVDGINVFTALVTFPFDPVAIQMLEYTVDAVCPICVSRPLSRIVPQ